jgi:sulfate adenylyltransferase subunit 1
VQWVIRPQTDAFHDYRGLAGTLLSGRLSKGNPVTLYPSGIQTVIARIESNGHDTETLEAGMPGVLHTDMDVDAPRGTLIVPSDSPIRSERQFGAALCWMSEQPYRPGERFLLRQNAFATQASIASVDARLDIRDLSEQQFEGSLGLNDIVRITVRTADPFTYDPYRLHRSMGAFILVSEATNNTVAAGMAED